MVICQGCGQSFSVPAGYGRNKIQCPGCGVICAVPPEAARGDTSSSRAGRSSAKKTAPEPPPESVSEDLAARMLEDPAPVPFFDDEPAPPPARAPAPAQPAKMPDMRIPCRRCRRLIHRQRECPSCDTEEMASSARPPIPTAASIPLELDDDSGPTGGISAGEEDDSPYILADKDIPLCPKCRKAMAPGSVFCTACGFDTQTRKKAKRTYEPIARSWDTDQSMAQRLTWLGIAWAVHVALAICWAIAGYSAWHFVVAWPFLTLMLVFILGTFERIEITRDGRGRAQLTKTWRFAFVPLKPVTTEVRGFEGVTTGTWHDAGLFEWLIFVVLLCSGIVPALVWWYNAIHKPHFHVALAINHAHPEVWVYRGKDENQMREIADVLINASGLRHLT